MDEQKNNNPNDNKNNMPKFNLNWIYGIIVVILIFLWATNSQDSATGMQKSADYSDFKTFVTKGYANKVVINNDEKTLRMYVKAEHVRDIFKQSAKQVGPDPFVTVEFGSAEKVESFLNAQTEKGKFNGKINYENKKGSFLWDVLISVGP
ncbi:MAG: ATP-dependent metallopeptidase FtsH/Yme1/Tma family protein, partial [Prevotellaceae bacterium]|nr:ATP-dependent metallopeptidase FtsH/Yme1/Tma family protein [Prevotellaceae bacterium]